jgi:hypothetical protein
MLCVEFGEDLITWVCLELNARALVSSWKVENLDILNVGVVGVFIAPTVGALYCGPAWLSGGAPDKSCRLSGVPPARALLLCARRRAFNAPLHAK